MRSVFSTLTNNLFRHLGLDTLRQLTSQTRDAMLDATFSKSLSISMGNFFSKARESLYNSTREVDEILAMMDAIYKKFSIEHGLKLGAPPGFSLLRYEKELDRHQVIAHIELHARIFKRFETAFVRGIFGRIRTARTQEKANRLGCNPHAKAHKDE